MKDEYEDDWPERFLDVEAWLLEHWSNMEVETGLEHQHGLTRKQVLRIIHQLKRLRCRVEIDESDGNQNLVKELYVTVPALMRFDKQLRIFDLILELPPYAYDRRDCTLRLCYDY